MRVPSLPLGLAAGSADESCTAGAPQHIFRLGSQGVHAIMKLFAYGTVTFDRLPGRWLHQAALGLACKLFSLFKGMPFLMYLRPHATKARVKLWGTAWLLHVSVLGDDAHIGNRGRFCLCGLLLGQNYDLRDWKTFAHNNVWRLSLQGRSPSPSFKGNSKGWHLHCMRTQARGRRSPQSSRTVPRGQCHCDNHKSRSQPSPDAWVNMSVSSMALLRGVPPTRDG